jgi:hypothetical protein
VSLEHLNVRDLTPGVGNTRASVTHSRVQEARASVHGGKRSGRLGWYEEAGPEGSRGDRVSWVWALARKGVIMASRTQLRSTQCRTLGEEYQKGALSGC